MNNNNNKYRLYKAACGIFRVKSAYMRKAAGGGSRLGQGVVESIFGRIGKQEAKQVASEGAEAAVRQQVRSETEDGAQRACRTLYGDTEVPFHGSYGSDRQPMQDRVLDLSDAASGTVDPALLDPYRFPDNPFIAQADTITTGPVKGTNRPLNRNLFDSLGSAETPVSSYPKDFKETLSQRYKEKLDKLNTPPVMSIYGFVNNGLSPYERIRASSRYMWNGVKKHPVRTAALGALLAELAADTKGYGVGSYVYNSMFPEISLERPAETPTVKPVRTVAPSSTTRPAAPSVSAPQPPVAQQAAPSAPVAQPQLEVVSGTDIDGTPVYWVAGTPYYDNYEEVPANKLSN